MLQPEFSVWLNCSYNFFCDARFDEEGPKASTNKRNILPGIKQPLKSTPGRSGASPTVHLRDGRVACQSSDCVMFNGWKTLT